MAKKILVVDDEENICKVIKGRLQASGYEVILAANGDEALEKIKEEPPDLIILDIMMPVMDGVETAKQIKDLNLKPPIPVIILTAKGDRKSVVDIMIKTQAKDYIAKPFDPDNLLNSISKLLEL
ncbi:MAG: response regulator [bacterium]